MNKSKIILFNFIFLSIVLQSLITLLGMPNYASPPDTHELLLPSFSQKNYETLLSLVDLSNAIANEYGYQQKNQKYPTSKEIPIIRNRIQTISSTLRKQGWTKVHKVYGKTGRNNVDPDAVAIVQAQPQRRLIVVAFHSSRSGNKNPLYHDGHGDWGSNYDSKSVSAQELQIPEIPEFVRIHRGYANNLASARASLLKILDQQVQKLGPQTPLQIWVTGHSKGGALAGLSAGVIQAHFRAQPRFGKNIRVGGIFFSAPRVFQGDKSIQWIHHLIGSQNLVHIQVSGDPIPHIPSETAYGYKSLGTLVLDSIQEVNQRTLTQYQLKSLSSWFNFNSWANYHYGCGLRGIGYEFDPNVVIPYHQFSHQIAKQ